MTGIGWKLACLLVDAKRTGRISHRALTSGAVVGTCETDGWVN